MYIWVVDLSASVYVVYFSVDAATAFVRQSSLSLYFSHFLYPRSIRELFIWPIFSNSFLAITTITMCLPLSLRSVPSSLFPGIVFNSRMFFGC